MNREADIIKLIKEPLFLLCKILIFVSFTAVVFARKTPANTRHITPCLGELPREPNRTQNRENPSRKRESSNAKSALVRSFLNHFRAQMAECIAVNEINTKISFG